MEKLVCLLWAEAGADREVFNAGLLERLPAALADAGASRIRLNLEDAQVAAGAPLRQSRGPRQHDAVVQFWLPSANPLLRGAIDRVLDGWLAEKGAPTPPPADDATFQRRVSLDLVGVLPSAEEAQAFAADRRPDKRVQLVRALLARDVDYADHWMVFWNDLLRNDYAGTGYIDGGRKQITNWLYLSLLTNKPYDRFTRELVAPSTDSEGFAKGIIWRGAVSAAQMPELQYSQSVSQTFLGINMKCASCHDSFVDRWKLRDAYGLAAIYSDQPMELVRCDIPTGKPAAAAWPFPELGQVDAAKPRDERLAQLAGERRVVQRLGGELGRLGEPEQLEVAVARALGRRGAA